MKRIYIVLFFTIGIFLSTIAQTKITGSIQEEKSGMPIPFATLSIDGKAATVANSEGVFALTVNSLVKLTVSCLGYQTATVNLAQTQTSLIIKLKQVEVGLDEVVIKSNPSLSIIDSAFKKAYAHAGKNYFGKAFMRQISGLNDSYTGINESFLNVKYSNYAILGWNPTQARYSKSDKNIALSNFNFISFATTGYLSTSVFATPLAKNAADIYNFKFEGYIKDGPDEIAIIDCRIKDKKSEPTIMYFEGKYFINTTTYNVSKIQGLVRNFKLNSKGPVKLDIMDSPLEAIYTHADNDDQFALKYANLTVNARIKYAGLLGGGKLKYNSQIYLLEQDNTLSNAPFMKLSMDVKDMDVLKELNYNPLFWSENPVIKRTPVEDDIIKDFEQKKMLGNYFNK